MSLEIEGYNISRPNLVTLKALRRILFSVSDKLVLGYSQWDHEERVAQNGEAWG